MKEREELELILNLIRKFNLPLSPILEYAIKEKMSEFPALDTVNENGEDTSENNEDNTYIYYHANDADFIPKSSDVKWFFLSALACLEGRMDKRSYQILADTLKGGSRSEIAYKYNLSQERIRQIVVKATKQAREILIEQRKSIEDTKAENAQLNSQLQLLREDIVRLKALLPNDAITRLGNENEEMSKELILLLETPIEAIGFPVRAANILMNMGVKKFADIPQIESSMRLLKERNSGRKTVHDVSRFLEDFHLTFGMSYTEIANVLKIIDWHNKKRKWIKENENNKFIEQQNEDETDDIEESINEASNWTSGGKEDKRIGYIVRLFPSQLKGEIVRVRKDSKGMKKLVVKTTSGDTVEVDDYPYLYEVLKRN